MTMQELANYRKKMKITQVALANEMGVSKGYINNIEKGNAGNEGVSEETKKQYAGAIHRILIAQVKGKQGQVEQVEKKSKKKAKVQGE